MKTYFIAADRSVIVIRAAANSGIETGNEEGKAHKMWGFYGTSFINIKFSVAVIKFLFCNCGGVYHFIIQINMVDTKFGVETDNKMSHLLLSSLL